MRRATAVLLLAASVPAWADRAERAEMAIRSLPVLDRVEARTIGETPLLVRGDLRGRALSEALATARALHADISARLLGARDGRSGPPPVDVCLLRSIASYDAFTRAAWGGAVSPRGFYSPAERVVVANMSAGKGNLRHEVVHALVGDDYPAVPAWLTEGLGALYGTSRESPSGFRGLVNYRLRALNAAIADGTVPTPEQLASSSPTDMYGPRAATLYATARYALLYLQERGRLEAFYRAVRDGEQSPAAFARALRSEIPWAEFLLWASALRAGARSP